MGLTENTATALLALNSLDVRPNSAVSVEGMEAGLIGSGHRVAVLASTSSQVPSNFQGESSAAGRTLLIGPMNAANLDADTRAFASIPSRHDVWRRITCDWLAGMVLTAVVDEEEATDMARQFAYGLAKTAYGFQREPVGRA
jgi:hypothetical protein